MYRGISSNTALEGMDDFAAYLKSGYTFDNRKDGGEVKGVVVKYLK